MTDLIAAFTHIPRLCDEFDVCERGILVNGVEERRKPAYIVQFAGQCGSEQKPSTCISVTHYRRESISIFSTCGLRGLTSYPDTVLKSSSTGALGQAFPAK
ncbi:hypothetical protein [Granulicella sp. L60]|uniref:hypothetical protein n=1 Tax=Granulicella sp. L60 TaxID=1641866 RepID=UPI00131AB48E|nr:hypothetical protein [Granulicella sp. L60]